MVGKSYEFSSVTYGHLKDKPTDSKPSTHPSLTANLATTSSTNYDDAIRLFATRECPAANPNAWMVDSGATEAMCS